MTDNLNPIIRMRALNSFIIEKDENGLEQFKTAGHRLEVMRLGSEEWEPIEVDAQLIEPPIAVEQPES